MESICNFDIKLHRDMQKQIFVLKKEYLGPTDLLL